MSNSSIGHSGGFGTQSSYPFGHNQGIQSVNPFRPHDTAMHVQTTFGQSSSFGNQPPLPLGGKAAAPPIQGGVMGDHPPLGFPASVSSTASVGFSRAAASGNPFGHKNKHKPPHNSSTTFGSSHSKQNGGSFAFTSGGASTTFGSASNPAVKPNNRSSEFGGQTQQNGFFGNEVSAFSGSNTTFTGNNHDSSGEQGTFISPLSKRGHKKGTHLHYANAAASTPLTSQTLTFGGQTSSMKVRKKHISSKRTPAFAHEKNPFATASMDSKAFNTPTIQTTFGTAAGKNKLKPSVAFEKPSAAGVEFPFTTFGGVDNYQKSYIPNADSQASVRGLSSSNKMVSMETRRGSTKASPFGHDKRVQESNSMTELDVNPFRGQQTMASYNPSGDTSGAPKVPKTSLAKEKQGKKRQARPKKKASSRVDEETALDLLVPTSGFNRDESSKAQLSAAINLDGLCTDMCSPAERELHLRVDELSIFEKCFPDRPGTERDMIIKRFQRSSADHKLDIPEEIRPPGVLRHTQLYIEQAIMDLDQKGLDPRFQTPRVPEPIELYNFCWDRFRMIRKDFVLQNYRGGGGRVHPIALDIHERIARYHVLSEHELIETPSFVAQQNMEQLGQTLKSLNELYDESHKVGDPAYLSPFEAEFRAYFILCTLDNGRGMDVLKYVKELPQRILESKHIKFAMHVFVARHTGDYFQFFSLLRQATYLQSCLLFRYIPNIRSSALLRMNRAYRSQTYPLEDLVELLCFDDIEHAYQVCQEHHLSITGMPNSGDDNAVMLKFGGEFETDVQLRRNNTPLKTRSSKIYVGIKQGNYLRRDICRGVTEYSRDEYPALSKLIHDTEQEERARLYPDRPMYEDDYSFFVDYNEKDNRAPNTSPKQRLPPDMNHKKHDLGLIARRKQELEQNKQVVLERMRELVQAKEEKARRDKAKKAAVEEAANREEQARQNIIAQIKAEKEADEALRQQQELAELQRRRQLDEQRMRADLEAREAERQRVAAQQQVEAMRMKAAEEKRRREQEELESRRRQAAREAERRRQQELAERREREAREAALEAERQAILAKELAKKKRERRAEKQRRDVLRLRMHIWKKYVQVSRNGSGPIQIDPSRLRLDQPHHKATESIHWLFSGAVGVSRTMTGKKRRMHKKQAFPSHSDMPASFWSSDDLLGLLCAPLCRQNPGVPSIAWKLVIADLQDNSFSPFGVWSAVRTGTQSVSAPKHDSYHVLQSTSDAEQGVAVCSRYLDSTFALQNTRHVQEEKLAATSAILLPVDLTEPQRNCNFCTWEQRVGNVFSSLKSSCRVIVVALVLASAESKPSQESLLNQLRSCMERIQSQFASVVVQSSVELIHADNLTENFSQVLKKMATKSPPVRQFKSVDFKEFLASSVKAVMNQFEASVALQRNICALFPRISDDIFASDVMDFVYPPPELHFAIVEPPRDWNSKSKQHEIRTILTALEVTHMTFVDSPLNRNETCDVYFKKIEDFIDRLFATYPAATAVSTYELKKRIYSALLPIHERLIQGEKGEQVRSHDADALLPWRKIFEEIYSTFFETLSDITIYYPADWDGRFGARVSSLVDATAHAAALKQCTFSGQTPTQDVKRPVKQVSMQSVRQSFGLWNTVDESMQKYRVMGAMKRLQVEIETERTASCQYKRVLRQALTRWDK